MRIAILGVGSIGGVILGALSDTDTDLVAVSRGQAAGNLEMIGLILHTPEGFHRDDSTRAIYCCR